MLLKCGKDPCGWRIYVVEVIAESEEDEVVAEEDSETETLFEEDIANLFADEEHLSEEFKTQAASLFEASVVARVNQQMETIENQ